MVDPEAFTPLERIASALILLDKAEELIKIGKKRHAKRALRFIQNDLLLAERDLRRERDPVETVA